MMIGFKIYYVIMIVVVNMIKTVNMYFIIISSVGLITDVDVTFIFF